MQQPAPTQSSPTFSDFAGLLATLASPPPDTTEGTSAWNNNDLGEDVATLSYERALRAHARYRPADRDNRLPAPPDGLGMDLSADAAIEMEAAGAAVAAGTAPAMQPAVAPDHDLRSASVTIRLSKAECARLHQRAAESALTVSAYLRSCALEAETLRAQVKQALAELKTAAETAKPAARARRSWFGWIERLIRRSQ